MRGTRSAGFAVLAATWCLLLLAPLAGMLCAAASDCEMAEMSEMATMEMAGDHCRTSLSAAESCCLAAVDQPFVAESPLLRPLHLATAATLLPGDGLATLARSEQAPALPTAHGPPLYSLLSTLLI